jgi:hypothetical protein
VALDAGETFPLDPDGVSQALARSGQRVSPPAMQGDCGAVLVTAEGLDETVVVWPRTLLPGTIGGRDTGVAAAQRLTLTDEGGAVRLRASTDDVSTQPLAINAPRCERRGVGYAWSELTPAGTVTLRAVEEIPGGCLALTFDDDARWTLCVPRDALPFEPGDRLTVRATRTDQARGVRLEGDRARLAVWRDVPIAPELTPPDLSARVTFGSLCTAHRDDCGAYVIPHSVRLGTAPDAVPGEGSISLGDNVSVRFGRAERVFATRDACAPRMPAPGAFVDYAVTTRGL